MSEKSRTTHHDMGPGFTHHDGACGCRQDIADRLWDAGSDLTQEGAREIERLRDQSAQRYAEIERLRSVIILSPTTITLGNVREAVWVAIHGSLLMTPVQVTETCGEVMDALDNIHLLAAIPEEDAENAKS